MNITKHRIQMLATPILFLAIFLFWYLAFPHALGYQEQFQLFMADGNYFVQRAAEPGGITAYVAEWLTQYYAAPLLGSLVIAGVMTLMQWMTYKASGHYALSFLPVILMWMQQGDESTLLAFPLAVALMALAVWLTPRRHPYSLSMLWIMPALYWTAGPVALLYAAVVPLRLRDKANWLTRSLLSALFVALTLAIIFTVAHYQPYPLSRLLSGLHYYRFVTALPWLMIGITMVTAVLTVIPATPIPPRRRIIMAVILLALAAVGIPRSYDERKYDLMEYDWLVRQQRWDDIISKSEKKQPDLPMSVAATNLALAMKGQLADRCMQFYQHGTEGLLPPFERNFSTIMLTGDAYYYLGLVNTSQRYAFEAMEAIPNYQKSARSVKRIAETNIINGQYAVARKYLAMLSKTIYYSHWAESRMEMINHPEKIDQDPVYGYLRRVRLTDDFLFSEAELDKMCGQLVMRSKDNMVAVQYLLMFPLLNRDLPLFMQYYSYVQSLMNYAPACCQEAAAFVMAQQRRLPPQQIEQMKSSATWKYLLGN